MVSTRPITDGNRSFLPRQRWLKNVVPSLSNLTIYLPAFSNHFLLPSTITVLSSLFHVGVGGRGCTHVHFLP
ncbi:unnamed protein product, partial [Ectocarpus sp. 13 AM-2016]